MSVLAACGSDESPTPATPPQPPTVVHAGVEPGPTHATLVSQVDPQGSDTIVFVEYGVDPVLDHRCWIAGVGASAGLTDVAIEIDALEPETVYAFHWVAANAGGETTSPSQTFTTLAGNRLPETEIVAATADTLLDEVRVQVIWRGIDIDGTIDHYEFWHAGRGQHAVEWVATSSTESLFVDIPPSWVFLVRAVDNDGAVDPTPGAWVYGDTLTSWALHRPARTEAESGAAAWR